MSGPDKNAAHSPVRAIEGSGVAEPGEAVLSDPIGATKCAEPSSETRLPLRLRRLYSRYGADLLTPRAPIAGLFYVGADAGSSGFGNHMCVESGFNVAGMVRDYRVARPALRQA